MKILFPTDGSETAEKAIEVAIKLAKKKKGEIIVAHVMKEKIPLRSVKEILEEFGKEFVIRSAERCIKNGVAGEMVIRSGEVAKNIIEVAKEYHVDVIAMGTRGSGLSKAILGSVAEQVCKSDIPTILVTSDGSITTSFYPPECKWRNKVLELLNEIGIKTKKEV